MLEDRWKGRTGDVRGWSRAEMTDTGKTRAQELLGDTAPELARLTDDVLFGQVWAAPSSSGRTCAGRWTTAWARTSWRPR